MRQLFLAMAATTAFALLAGCTTSDTLTPPAAIGDGGQQTATTQPAGAQAGNAPQALDSPGQTSLAAEEDRNSQETPFPQNATMANNGIQQPQPSSGPRSPMLGSPGGVSATQKSIYQASNEPPAAAPAVAATGGSIRFLPIIGAPIAAVTPLSRELANSAAARGLSIKPSSDTTTDNMLKGYFSAFDDGGGTTIVYVWDVLDGSGSRLTRIQGQEKLPGKSSDPWANVQPDTMRKIADDTISKYIAWKSASRG